jgi:hypothetical protein
MLHPTMLHPTMPLPTMLDDTTSITTIKAK